MISVICSTNRKNSNSKIFSEAILKLAQNSGQEAQLLCLEDLPEDFNCNNEVFGNGSQKLVEIQDQYVTDADRFVFVLPEYNGSFPGAIKSFIDSFAPSRIHNKKALLIGISSGRAGNVRGMEHFTGILNYLRVAVYPFKPAVAHCNQVIEEGVMQDERTLKLLDNTLQEFLEF